MHICCLRAFAMRGLAEGFRLAEEGEGFTCPECGTTFRSTNGQWMPTEGGSKTVNVVRTEQMELDLGWARAYRQGSHLAIQCWGCGGTVIVPDRPFIEYHFEHADPTCSYRKAMLNKAHNAMPAVKGH